MGDVELLEKALKAAGLVVDRVCGRYIRVRQKGRSNGFWITTPTRKPSGAAAAQIGEKAK